MFDDDDEFQRDPSLTPAQQEFEGALRGLRPASPASVSRERMLFKAGVVVGRRSVNRWRGLGAVLVVGNAMWMTVSLRPNTGVGTPELVQGSASTPHPQPAPVVPLTAPVPATQHQPLLVTAAWLPEPPPASLSSSSAAGLGYLSMRDALLRQGLTGLPPARAASARPSRAAEPLDVEQLLGGPDGASSQQDQQSRQPPASPWAPLRRLFYGEHL